MSPAPRRHRVVRPQSPAPATGNTDEMVIPGRVGVVLVASGVLTAGASATVVPTPCSSSMFPRSARRSRTSSRRRDRRPALARANSSRLDTSDTGGQSHCQQLLADGATSTQERFDTCSTDGSQRRHLLVKPAEGGQSQGGKRGPELYHELGVAAVDGGENGQAIAKIWQLAVVVQSGGPFSRESQRLEDRSLPRWRFLSERDPEGTPAARFHIDLRDDLAFHELESFWTAWIQAAVQDNLHPNVARSMFQDSITGSRNVMQFSAETLKRLVSRNSITITRISS